jgi:hypothetical protein
MIGGIDMLAYKFETRISESGLVKIPQEILDKVKDHLVEVVIFQDESMSRKGKSDFRHLRGKYKGYLSTTEEFSRRKASEKEKEL